MYGVSFTCVPLLVQETEKSHSCTYMNESCTCVTLLMPEAETGVMCVAHAYGSHDAFICDIANVRGRAGRYVISYV